MALSALLFIGCVLIAYGPAAALLFGFVARRAQLLVLSVASAFVWLFALLLAAVLWIIVPPLKTTHVYGVIVGVLAQALLRWLFVKGYLRVEGRILDVLPRSDPMGVNDFSSAIAAGLGFGVMHAVVAYGSILGYSGHSQALYSDACSEMTIYLLSAVSGLVFSLGHVAWMVVAFDAERRQSRLRWIGTIALHAATALVVRPRSRSLAAVPRPRPCPHAHALFVSCTRRRLGMSPAEGAWAWCPRSWSC